MSRWRAPRRRSAPGSCSRIPDPGAATRSSTRDCPNGWVSSSTAVRRRGRPPAPDPPHVFEPFEREGPYLFRGRSGPEPPWILSARVCRTSPRRSTSTCPPSAGASGRGSSRSRDRSSSCARMGVATSVAPNAAAPRAGARRRLPGSPTWRSSPSAATGSRATSSRSPRAVSRSRPAPRGGPGGSGVRGRRSRSNTSGVGRATRCPARRPSWPSAPRRVSSASTTSTRTHRSQTASGLDLDLRHAHGPGLTVSLAIEETPASFLTCHSPVAEPAPASRTIGSIRTQARPRPDAP